uniref:Uncharacterized protein n=1 Tax=Fagus sylvatica TaxID=28930 RepID=A0A2N9EBL5_FAGSY
MDAGILVKLVLPDISAVRNLSTCIIAVSQEEKLKWVFSKGRVPQKFVAVAKEVSLTGAPSQLKRYSSLLPYELLLGLTMSYTFV